MQCMLGVCHVSAAPAAPEARSEVLPEIIVDKVMTSHDLVLKYTLLSSLNSFRPKHGILLTFTNVIISQLNKPTRPSVRP
jgi:hypothetical protein